MRDEGYLALMPRAIKAALGSIDARDVKHLLVQGPQRFAAAVAQGARHPRRGRACRPARASAATQASRTRC